MFILYFFLISLKKICFPSILFFVFTKEQFSLVYCDSHEAISISISIFRSRSGLQFMGKNNILLIFNSQGFQYVFEVHVYNKNDYWMKVGARHIESCTHG